jgi:hypothetical protein
MKTTEYAERRIAEYGVTMAHAGEALNNEVAREVQEDGRIRVWGWVEELGYYVSA